MARDEQSFGPDDRRQEEIIPPDGAEAEERDVRLYDASWDDMPPSPAGADVDIGGEAAASRRVAGLPPSVESLPEHVVGEATPGREPFLGYDGLATDDVIAWIESADPDAGDLRVMYEYERSPADREAVLHELGERLRRAGERPERQG